MEIKYFNKDSIVKKPFPKWLEGHEEAYKENKAKFAIVWSMGFPTDVPCGLILNFPPEWIYVIATLYNSKEEKMRSQYRISLKRQLHKWLSADPENDDIYESPFSDKQWVTLMSPQIKRNVFRRLQDIRRILAS
jgi:hypothetical protein